MTLPLRPARRPGLRPAVASLILLGGCALTVLVAALVSPAPAEPAARLSVASPAVPRPAVASPVLARRAASPRAASPAATCTPVLFVGVDGSGEAPRSDTVPFGRTVAAVYRAYAVRALTGARAVEVHRVPLTAPPSSVLRPHGATGDASHVVTARRAATWRAGVPRATTRLRVLLRSAARRCPDQQVVLAGYAQGAMAVHRALADRLGAPVLRRVVGVALVADGDRAGTPHGVHLVGQPAARPAGRGLAPALLTGVGDVPRAGHPLAVWEVCTRGDLVCDLSRTPVRRALAVHRGYGSVLDRVGAMLWNRTARWPVPVPAAWTLTTRVGVPVDRQLRADGPRTRSVRWHALSALPPGLRLGRHGRLHGTATRAGAWTLHYTVRDTAGSTFDRPLPGVVTVSVAASTARHVDAGGVQTCLTRSDHRAYCWGRNNWGQLGDHSLTNSSVPAAVRRGGSWRSISTGGSTTCAVAEDRTLWCWGLNRMGQLGTTDYKHAKSPHQVGDKDTWRQVSASWFHTCGVRVDGTLWCWGSDDLGQLGTAGHRERRRPTQVGTGTTWTSVSTGGWHTCATRSDHTLWCWGANGFGQLGDGTRRAVGVPEQVGRRFGWRSVSASWADTCAVRRNGMARCWGADDNGQLGNGTKALSTVPVPVSGDHRFTRVSVGDLHACGVDRDGGGWCWGRNDYGQLGDGTIHRSGTPVRVAGDWASISAGWWHTCGIRTDGTTACWGDNEVGQLGDGSTTDRRTPVPADG